MPIVVHKDYELPGFVGSDTLLLAVSASGSTEETLHVATEAVHAGARLVAVSQGGALAELAGTAGAPHITVPAEIVMPRTGLGALAVPLLIVLEQLGLCPGAEQGVQAAVSQLRRRRDALARPGNEAEVLARTIGRTIPLVYGGGALGAVAAQRWKAQCNENAKVPAFANRLPELCHNEVAGWGQHGDVTRQVLTLVELRHDFEHPQIDRRFGLVNDLVDEVVGSIERVDAEGEGPLAQLFDLVMFGDVVSRRPGPRRRGRPGAHPRPRLRQGRARVVGPMPVLRSAFVTWVERTSVVLGSTAGAGRVTECGSGGA